MIGLIKMHKPVFWWAERGQISKAIGPFLRKRMMEESAFAAIVEMTPTADKQTRAQSLQGRMAMGKVFFPRFAPWWPEARNQLLKFPYGANDDFVDALAYIGLGLTLQTSANPVRRAQNGARPGTYGWLINQSRLEEQRERAERDSAGF
jgi:predicted phage terminase large subunit-like protein